MFAALALTALLASAIVSHADVTPNEPGPGTISNQGTTCHIAWVGDTNSTTAWKDMSIELMTGSNFGMVHLTTVTTSPVDGTQSGTYDYPCPAVTPNSAIYFYQFTATATSDITWTTRFTIASATGQSVPPANAVQPNSGAAIPWGVGALVDPSTATPPPAGVAASNATSSAVLSSTSSSSSSSASSSSSSSFIPSLVASESTSSPSTTASQSTPANAAVGGMVVEKCVWQAAIALSASALAFSVLL